MKQILRFSIFIASLLFAQAPQHFFARFGSFDATEQKALEQLKKHLDDAGIGYRLREENGKVVVESKEAVSAEKIDTITPYVDDLKLFKVEHAQQKRKDAKTAGQRVHMPIVHDVNKTLFGKNDAFVYLMEEGLSYRKSLEQTKERYLRLQAARQRSTGLTLRGGAERAIEHERNGYYAGISWDLFDQGYFGSKAASRRAALAKAADFERNIAETTENYAKIARYEIEAIKQHILYSFAEYETKMLRAYLKQLDHKLRQGLITRMTRDKYATMLQKTEMMQRYLSAQQGKAFDVKYRKLISRIEKTKLLSREKVKAYTIQNAPQIKMEARRAEAAGSDTSLLEKIRASLFVERKSYTFITRDETLAGIDVKLPLDIDTSGDELQKLEKQYSMQRRKSIEAVLRHQVDALLDTIAYHKERIAEIQKELAYENRLLGLARSGKYSAAGGDPFLIDLKMTELTRDLWLERADVLGALLRLQYLSGVKLM